MSKQKPAASESPLKQNRIVPLDKLMEHPRNYRVHPKAQIDKLVLSLQRFGQGRSIVCQDGPDKLVIVAGHGVFEAATALQWKELRADILPAEWSDAQIEGYLIADNQHSQDASENEELLAMLLQEQQDAGFDLASLGSDDETLRQMLESLGDSYLGDGTDGEVVQDIEDEEEDVTGSGSIFSDEVIRLEAFRYWRNAGFPYRKMPLYLCMQEINKLASIDDDRLLHSTLGYHVADMYHSHRYHAGAEGMKSPYEAYCDDDLLMRAMRVNQEMGRGIPLEVSHLLYMVSGTQACSNFRPGFAMHLYRKYCKPGFVVLDTSTGYGGRLLGFIASGLAGCYIGIDPNTATHQANIRMAADLCFADKVELYNLPAEDVPHERIANRCDFAFTSPPYFAKEHYSDDDTQSWKRYNTGDAWREGFLQKMLALQFASLKPGSTAIVNIADVKLRGKTYPLSRWTIEDGKAVGFDYLETQKFSLGHRFGVEEDLPTEPVIVFRKPSLERVEVPAHA